MACMCVVENWINDNYKNFMIKYIYFFRDAMSIIFSQHFHNKF